LAVSSRARSRHYADRAARRRQVVNFITWWAAAISASFAVLQLVTERSVWYLALLNVVLALIFAGIPLLHRFGRLVAPLTLILATFASLTLICWSVGTDSGLQFFFVVVAAAAVLVPGIDYIVLAATLVGISVVLVIVLEYTAPRDTGLQPGWSLPLGFFVSITSACAMSVAAVSYSLRETERAEEAMELTIKGKGVMRTWFLVGELTESGERRWPAD